MDNWRKRSHAEEKEWEPRGKCSKIGGQSLDFDSVSYKCLDMKNMYGVLYPSRGIFAIGEGSMVDQKYHWNKEKEIRLPETWKSGIMISADEAGNGILPCVIVIFKLKPEPPTTCVCQPSILYSRKLTFMAIEMNPSSPANQTNPHIQGVLHLNEDH
jgi:hypothetical protein